MRLTSISEIVTWTYESTLYVSIIQYKRIKSYPHYIICSSRMAPIEGEDDQALKDFPNLL